MVVAWSNSAKAELKKAFDYIALDSLQNAQMVRDTLIDLTLDLHENPKNIAQINLKNIMTGVGGLLKNIITVFPIVFWKIRSAQYACGIPACHRLAIDHFLTGLFMCTWCVINTANVLRLTRSATGVAQKKHIIFINIVKCIICITCISQKKNLEF